MIGKKTSDYPKDGFKPDAYLINEVTTSMDRNLQEPNLIDPSTGLMLQGIEYEGLVKVDMYDLKNFPFDQHSIKIFIHQAELQSRNDFVMVLATPNQEAVRLFYNPPKGTEFRLRGYTAYNYEDLGGNGIEYSNLEVHIAICREPTYYLWKLVFPLFIVSIFTFSAYFFSIDDLSERTAITTTMILATSALLYVLAESLPRTSTLTILDKYLLCSLFLQLITAFESWLVNGAYFAIDYELALSIDRVFKIACPSIFCILTFYFFIPRYIYFQYFMQKQKPDWLVRLNKLYKGKAVGGEFFEFIDGVNVFGAENFNPLPSLIAKKKN